VSGEEAVGALCVAEVFGESGEGFEGAGSEPRGEGVLHPPCYLLMEAEHALRSVGDPRPSLRFDNEDYGKNLGRFITYFDDDTKSRLGMRLRIRRMGDLKSPQRKRVGTLIIGGKADGDVEEDKDKEKEKEGADDTEDKPPGRWTK